MLPLAEWKDFAAAQVGASAALAGLIFVGVSLHLGAVRTWKNLRPRVFEAIVVLGAVFLTCSLLLVPGQSVGSLGTEIAAVGVALLVSEVVGAISALLGIWFVDKKNQLPAEYRASYLVAVFLVLVSAAMIIVAGLNLGGGSGEGIFPWLIIGFGVCYLIAMVDAYMFLILLNDPPEVPA